MTDFPRPPGWNWVEERAKCSAVVMFEKLRRMAQANTVQRNKQLGGDRFQFTESGQVDVRALAFTVIDAQLHNEANFELKGHIIHASLRNGGSPLQATLTLTDDGLCKLKVGNDELEPWLCRREDGAA